MRSINDLTEAERAELDRQHRRNMWISGAIVLALVTFPVWIGWL